MTSLKVFIFITYIVMIYIMNTSSGKELSKLTGSNQHPFLNQRASNAFLNKRHYGYGGEDKEGSKDLTKPTKPPKTSPTPCLSECDEKCGMELCRGSNKNHTIDVGCGKKVVCVVPTEEELIQQLDAIGGYNRHYVALTMEEAEKNFDDLLKPRLCPGFKGRGKKIGHLRKGHPHYESCRDGKKYKRSMKTCGTDRCLSAGYEIKNGKKLACPFCQKCRELPKDVFPRFVNEITCGSASSLLSDAPPSCLLKGIKIGSCNQRSMTIDVLTKKADEYKLISSNAMTTIYEQVWSSQTEEIRTCCECMDD